MSLTWTAEKRAVHGQLLARIKYRRGPKLPSCLASHELDDYRRLTRSCRYTRREAVQIILGGRRGQMA